MPVSVASPTRLSFSGFELDLTSGELRKDGKKIALPPKAFETLRALGERPGEVVTREELRAKLWAADTFVEFDDSLNHAINRLRQALGDSAENPQFIETLPRYGYRFIAAVQRDYLTLPSGSEGKQKFGSKYKWIVVATLVIASAAVYVLWNYGPKGQGQPRRPMLAILPLDNLTGNEELDYLSDGITEEIITELGRMNPDRLGVIARTSTSRYKKTTKTVAEMGRELGVDYVIEGSLRQASPRLRVTVQLIRVSDQTHLWAEAYDINPPEAASIDKDVADHIAGSLGIETPPVVRARFENARPVNPKAREAYLRGRYWLTRGTGTAASNARQYLERAIELDPNYAQAYASLAYAYIFLGNYGVLPQTEAKPKAKEFAERSLALDDSLLDGRLALAGIMAEYEWNFAGAAKLYQGAVTQDPNSAAAHQWYSALLSEIGRSEEAIGEIKKAYELDPISLRVGVDFGRAYYWARHYDEAIEQYHKVLELDPNYSGAHSMLGLALLEKREYEQAVSELQKGVALIPDNKEGYSIWLGYAYAVVGKRNEAQLMLATQVAHHAQTHAGAQGIALTYLGLGDKDQAFNWLETAYRERDAVAMLKAYPFWDSIRSDPRFQDLLRRVGLPTDTPR
jgi:TolB-like protein/DNA-binding winged helix-turn-helix (wHTH) protein/Flp pilus assembly protein TadD